MKYKKEYVENGGGFCPFCKSEKTRGYTGDFIDEHAFQKMQCFSCFKQWTDIFTLSDVEPKEE